MEMHYPSRISFNPLQPGVAFLYPLKTSENLYSLKKPIEVHFNRSKVFLLQFYDEYDVNQREKNFRQKYGLLIQSKFLYRVSSFYEKRINIAED